MHRDGNLPRVRDCFTRWRPQERQPDDLEEAVRRECGCCRQRCERKSSEKPFGYAAEEWKVEQRLRREPLRGEPVEWRKPRDCGSAHEDRRSRPRRTPQHPAEPVEVDAAPRPFERTGAEEEEALEQRVVERVKQRRRERERGPGLLTLGEEEEARTESEERDSDVVDGREGEKLLEISLEERVEDSADRRDRPEREHEPPDPDRGCAEPLDQYANEPIQTDLDHDATHQRRDRRRCDRVRSREPGVERKHSRLGAEPDDCRNSDDCLKPRTGLEPAAADEAMIREEQQSDPDSGAAEMRDGDVDEHCSSGARVATANEDDRCGQQRHQLPAEQKRQWVASTERPDQGQDEQRAQHPDGAIAISAPEVRSCEDERGSRHQAEHSEEDPGQRVDPEMWLKRAGERTPGTAIGDERPEPRHADKRRTQRLEPEAGGESAPCSGNDGAGGEQRNPGEERRAHSASISASSRRCSSTAWRTSARPASRRRYTSGSATR